MNTFFGFEVLVGVFVGVLFATIVVLIMHMRTTAQVSKMTFPAYEYAMKKAEHDSQALITQAQEKSRSIVSDAQKKSNNIVLDAEKLGQETISKYTGQATDIQNKFKEIIAGQTQNIGQSLHSASDAHLHELEKMLKSTELALLSEQKKVTDLIGRTSAGLEAIATEAEHHAEKTAESLQGRITKVSQTIESRLLRAEAEGEDKLTSHLDALQKVADSHIAAYETSRTKLMDAHIEQLVSSVIEKVLYTQLPVAEHSSLARKALEEAKAKNIL